jgi:signal transduction histidine kinase
MKQGDISMSKSLPSIELPDVYAIGQIFTRATDWKSALDQIIHRIRPAFIFDNFVVYLLDPKLNVIEVAYAKATGRGHSAQAEVAWGETISNQVLQSHCTILQEPNETTEERLQRPYLLATPLQIRQEIIGTIVFIRFGGPAFTDQAIQFAEYLAANLSLLINYQNKELELSTVESLRRTLRAQGDFIATLSHEIRSPLGFIKGYTTTLLRPDAQWDLPTQQQFLRIIDQETDRMEKLLQNLLDSAQWESGQVKMDWQPVRIETLLHDLALRFQTHHPELHIELHITQPLPLLQGDPRRLSQVFDNIVTNTLKYAPNSPVIIYANQTDQQIELRFEDHGPGIPAEYLPMVFERFFRGPEQAVRADGSGLGLFICRQIILAHQGNIFITSQPGQGTNVHIQLPCSPTDSSSSKEAR